MGTALVIAPAVALIPPHVPWAFMALGLGGFMGSRKWKERFTVISLEGYCPKCGGPLSIRSGTPLRPVLTVPCDGCNHESRLTTPFSTPVSTPVSKQEQAGGPTQ